MSTISRNNPCPCGSGKRYKHCCGQAGEDTATVQSDPATNILQNTLQQALSCQLSGQLNAAREHYERALRMRPDHFDTLHMLGVTLYQLGNAEQGARLILRAIKLIGDHEHPATLTNLGLCLAKVAKTRGLTNVIDSEAPAEYCHPSFFRKNNLPRLPVSPPGISLVIPSYNHARFIEKALRSAFEQDYPEIELIVIDDGSRDESVERINVLLRDCPFPHTFIARGNIGAHATINEGIRLARHPWITILNSDDWYAPQRIERMMRAISGGKTEWAFSGISIIDDSSRLIVPGIHLRADTLFRKLEQRYRIPSFGYGFSGFNFAITTGNLVFTKNLWQRLDGFSDLRYNHDWDFCLRAASICEPAYLDEPLYYYRLHETNTISESGGRAQLEANEILQQWFRLVTGNIRPENPEISRINQSRWELIRDEQLLTSARGHEVGKARLFYYASILGLD